MKNPPLISAFDGIGMGIGFTVALIFIGGIRELLARNHFGITVTPASIHPISIFILAPGAFFVLSILTALQNKLNRFTSATNGSAKEEKENPAAAATA